MKSSTNFLRMIYLLLIAILIIAPLKAQVNYGLLPDARWPYGASLAIEKSGDLVFIGDGAMLKIYNVSLPADPVLLSMTEMYGAPYDLKVSGDILYTTHDVWGISIYDISNAEDPALIGSYSIDKFFPRIEINEETGYLSYSKGIDVLDLSDKANPELLESIELDYYPRSLKIFGDFLYAPGYRSMKIFDITNASQPVLASELVLSDYSNDVLVVDNIAFLSMYDSLYCIDVTDPYNLSIVRRYGDIQAFNSLQFENDILFSSNSAGRIYAWEWKNNTLAYKRNNYFNSDHTEIIVENGIFYASSRHGGLDIVDVSDITAMNRITLTGNSSYSMDVEADEDYIYLANFNNGLSILKEGSGYSVEMVGSFPFGEVRALSKKDNTLYIAKYRDGLGIIDVTDPTAPLEIGSFNPEGSTYDFDIAGNYAYLAQGANGLIVLDISDLKNPNMVGSVPSGHQTINVRVRGNYAFVSEYLKGVMIVDISDPTQPIEVGRYDDDPSADIYVGNVFDVELKGDLAFITDHSYGFQVVDISDVTRPTKVHSEWTGLRPYDIELDGNFLYIALSHNGLAIYDISNVEEPEKIGWLKIGGELEKITLRNGKIYGAQTDSGFFILNALSASSDDQWQPLEFNMRVVPNPADINSVLEIESDDVITAGLMVVSVDGKVLVEMQLPVLAGKNTIPMRKIWCEPINTGMYYVVIRSGNGIKSIPVVMK
jgi:hypothetical protein